MSRRRARTPANPQHPSQPASSDTARIDPAALPPDLLRRLAVERMLAQRAEGRGTGGRPASAAATAMESVTTVVPVAGMTCRSCEVRIQRYVGRIPNVQRVRASAVHGRVEIVSTGQVPAAAVAKALNAAGYEIGRTPWLERDVAVWATAAGGVVLVAAIALLAQVTGLSGLASGAGDLSSGGLVVALLLGVAAGFSTCMALVGGLVLALSASFQARRAASGIADGGLGAQMRPAVVFTAGRIIGYGVLGAALGAVGASVTMPPQVTAVLMVAVAVVMTILGARLTGLSPRIATWSPTLPLGLGRWLGLGEGAGSAGQYSDARAAALGAASFFLPCGFTQAVQIYALSTGSPLLAGALLAVFAIGTAPGLLALAGLPVVVPGRLRPTLLRLVGVVVLGFAFINASAGIRLSGVTLPLPGVDQVAAAAPSGPPPSDGIQKLTTYQEIDGYSPTNVTIYAGIPTRWTIESQSTASCAASLVVPDLNIFERLDKGPNTIELPPLSAGTLRYSCAMGMYGGRITVVEPPAGWTGGSGAEG